MSRAPQTLTSYAGTGATGAGAASEGEVAIKDNCAIITTWLASTVNMSPWRTPIVTLRLTK